MAEDLLFAREEADGFYRLVTRRRRNSEPKYDSKLLARPLARILRGFPVSDGYYLLIQVLSLGYSMNSFALLGIEQGSLHPKPQIQSPARHTTTTPKLRTLATISKTS